jgi:hypothetical protein
VGALAHYLEGDGIATTQISLIREHTESIRPPRALWVPFELGHPLGSANDIDFQLDVLRTVLNLSARSGPPVLEDYPHDAPSPPSTPDGWSCPVALPVPESGDSEEERLSSQLLEEMQLLGPWYSQGRRERDRTAVGLSGLTGDSMEQAAVFLATYASGGTPGAPVDATVAMPTLLRFVADDVKAYYFEAAAARPGQVEATSNELRDWLFFETVLGGTLLRIRDRFASASSDEERRLQGGLVPAVVLASR